MLRLREVLEDEPRRGRRSRRLPDLSSGGAGMYFFFSN